MKRRVSLQVNHVKNVRLQLGEYELILRRDRHAILIKQDQPDTEEPLFEDDLTEQELADCLSLFSYMAVETLETLAQYS